MNRSAKIICLLILSLTVSLVAYAQNTRLTINVTDVPVAAVIDQIEQQSGYYFIYSKNVIDENRTVSLKVKDASLKEVLNSLFAETGIAWKIEKKQIVLSRKTESASVPVSRIVSGRVLEDSNGLPMQGVTVMIEGTTTGTSTDGDGRFSLKVTDGATIRISSIGFKDEILTCQPGIDNVTVLMKEDFDVLSESVVVGYGTVSKKNMTTAVVSVKADEVPKAANSNLNSLLMGRAPGLQANQTSGQPDGKVDLSIRGGGTPIYVVDGVVMPSSAISISSGNINMPSNVNRSGMGSINPADIESIEILKD
ncbi:MAG: secretin and TonB N-terminal domain-containing protein, partial [Candidatus Cryptobacteroides sp.]